LELSASESLFTVTVELADRGPGIHPGEEEHIFEKFVRGRGATGGFGLGLAICRAIINAHGGKIWAENREGGGAVFRFTLSAAGIPPLPKEEEEQESGRG
jgi:two-component system sensor histidine kinase KdpD